MNGSVSSRKSIIEENEGLVKSISMKFATRGELNDIVQAGYLGLLKAMSRFDESLGNKFSTFAVPYIIGEIKMYLRSNMAYHVPRTLTQLANKCRKTSDELEQELARKPTVSEIAARLGLAIDEIALALESNYGPVSIDITDKKEDDVVVIPDTKSQTDIEKMIDSISLKESLAKLSNSERNIFALRFLENRSQVMIAGLLGISQSKVHRLEKEILLKIRNELL